MLLHFSKPRHLRSSNAAFTIVLFAADHKQQTLKHRNKKKDRNPPPIKNHKSWPFEPVEVNFCFLRGPLRWVTPAKNANVSWLLNLHFLKSTVITSKLNKIQLHKNWRNILSDQRLTFPLYAKSKIDLKSNNNITELTSALRS